MLVGSGAELLQDLLLGGHLEALGCAEGAPRASGDVPAQNAEGDPYGSDGLRAVMVLSPVAVAPRDTRILPGFLPGRLGTPVPFPADPAVAQLGPISR